MLPKIGMKGHGNEYDSANVSESYKEKEETDTRKLAAEHMHVAIPILKTLWNTVFLGIS